MNTLDIKIVDHNPQWTAMFQEEAACIAHILGEQLVAIFHYGSTAVPGLPAKPIVDIMPVVVDLQCIYQCEEVFKQLGYIIFGEAGVPGRIYMEKGGRQRTHHISAYQADQPHQITTALAFRNYLRAHPPVAQAYGREKQKAAALFPKDYKGYSAAKAPMVEKIAKDALAWHWKNNHSILDKN